MKKSTIFNITFKYIFYTIIHFKKTLDKPGIFVIIISTGEVLRLLPGFARRSDRTK